MSFDLRRRRGQGCSAVDGQVPGRPFARCSWALLAAPGILLFGGILAMGVVASGCGGYDEPAEQPAEPKEEPPPPPPPPKPISLAALSPVRLDPGQRAEVELQVDRAGNKGAIEVGVEGVPAGVTVGPVEIAEGESAARLDLAAAEKLGDEELKATIQVTVKLGELEAKQPLALTVNKVKLPSFVAPDAVIFQPGTKKTIDLNVQRDEFEGPLELRVEDVPEKFTATVANVAAGESATKVEIAAAADAPEGAKKVRVAATVFGRTVDVEVPFQIDRSPYLVKSFMVVTLEPGETKGVEIPIERRSYKGPVVLEVVDLPEGVTVPKVDVTPDEAKAALLFSASADAKEGVHSAKVRSTGGQLSRTDPLVVRVAYPDSGFLPREVTAGEDSTALLRRGSFGGRLTTESRQALMNAYGGTEESEQAVLRGLRWLAAHQASDGHWSLEYWKNVPDCDCPSEIEKKLDDSDTAATAFGVLPMLGIGITHRDGPDSPRELIEYRKKVFAGLTYLTQHQVGGTDKNKAGNLGGNMYAHALGTMALCEAYGLSGDERLKVPAQLAVRYMAEAQHKAGGWRYGPGQAGDMSVTAWVFLAIRSAQLAGLPIGRTSLLRAERFVDSCAVGPEEAKLSRYGYLPPTPEQPAAAKLTLSAAGLLTRQYLGWPKETPDLVAGCRYLTQNLPPESGSALGQIYYYHYASQVLHHMEGSEFDLWNHRMREHLIRTQEKEGHKAGSWNPQGTDYGSRGGRLYATAMALLTLEVYYRHLPMYRPVKRTAE